MFWSPTILMITIEEEPIGFQEILDLQNKRFLAHVLILYPLKIPKN